jgi:hypothetical protein
MSPTLHFCEGLYRLIFAPAFLLVRHPRVLTKLRAETSAACEADIELTRTQLRNMNYLQNVLKESA